MPRSVIGLGAVLALALLALSGLASPAVAQYGPYGPSGPTTTVYSPYGPTTTVYSPYGPATTVYSPSAPPPTTTCPPACPAFRGRAVLSEAKVAAGSTVTVSGPAGSFGPASPANVRLVRVREGATPLTLSTTNTGPDGGISAPITIPAGTESGVYFVFIEATDPAGQAKVLLAPLAVTVAATGSRSGTTGVNPGGSERPTPPIVAAVEPSFVPSEEPAVVEDVDAGRARLVVDDDVLRVTRVGNDSGGSGWVVAAVAAALAGFGLIALRRRGTRRPA